MKNELRHKYKIKRRYVGVIQREVADIAICETFLQAYGNFQTYLVYNSFDTEADTQAIIRELLALGKTVLLPRVEGEEMVAVPYGQTLPNRWGIEEPVGQAYLGEIDVVVTPLLCVNPSGYRLGYGKGYYDRFLRSHPTSQAVGIGYAMQIAHENFQEEHDIPLQAFVCEKGVYFFEKQS